MKKKVNIKAAALIAVLMGSVNAMHASTTITPDIINLSDTDIGEINNSESNVVNSNTIYRDKYYPQKSVNNERRQSFEAADSKGEHSDFGRKSINKAENGDSDVISLSNHGSDKAVNIKINTNSKKENSVCGNSNLKRAVSAANNPAKGVKAAKANNGTPSAKTVLNAHAAISEDKINALISASVEENSPVFEAVNGVQISEPVYVAAADDITNGTLSFINTGISKENTPIALTCDMTIGKEDEETAGMPIEAEDYILASSAVVREIDLTVSGEKTADNSNPVINAISNPRTASIGGMGIYGSIGGNVENKGTGNFTIGGNADIKGDAVNTGGGTMKTEGNPAIGGNITNGSENEKEPKSTFTNEGTVSVGGENGVTNYGKFTNGSQNPESPSGNAHLNVQKGGLDNKGDFTNYGSVDLGQNDEDNGAGEQNKKGLDNSGKLTNSGTITAYGGRKNTNSGTFENQGAFQNTEGSFENKANGKLTNSANFKTGNMTNEGDVINKNTSGQHFQASSFENKGNGSVTNESGADMSVDGLLTNSASANDTSREKETQKAGFDNKGKLTAGSLTNNGDFTNQESGNVTVTNELKNGEDAESSSAQSETKKTAEWNNHGSLTAGTLTNSGEFNNKRKDDNQEKPPSVTVTDGDLTNKGTFNNGEKEQQSEGSVNVKKGKLYNQSGADFNNFGDVEIGDSSQSDEEEDSEKLNNAGNLTNNSSGTITTHGGTNKNSGKFKNSGTFNGTSSKFDNESDGEIENNLRFNVGDMTNKGKVKNSAPSGTGTGYGFTAGSFNNQAGGIVENAAGSDFTVMGELQNLTDNEAAGEGKEDDGIINSGNIKAGKLTNGGNITNKKSGNINVQTTDGVETSDGSMTNNPSGKIENEGTITVSGDTTNDGGTIDNNGGTFSSNNFTNKNNGTVKNENNGNFTVSGELKNEGGSVTNGSGSTFTVKGKTVNGSENGESKDSIIDNGGTFNAEGGLDNKKDGKFTNKNGGNVQVGQNEQGEGQSADVDNKGEIDNQGQWTTKGKTNNSGTLKNGDSASYESDDKVTNSGSIENSGSFFAFGSDGMENSGTLNNSGTFSVQDGNFKNTGKSDSNKGVTNSGTFTVGGEFENSGDFSNEGEYGQLTLQGELKNQTGGTLTNKDGATVEVTGNVTNQGEITNENDSTFTATGGVINNSGGKITNKSKKNGQKGGMSLGSVTNDGGTITNDGGTLTADSLTNGNGSSETGSNNSKVENKNGGEFTVEGLTNNNGGEITNTGSGSIFNAKGVTNNDGGSIKNENGATFNAEGVTNNEGSITNSGSGSTFNAKGKVTNGQEDGSEEEKGTITNSGGAVFNAEAGLDNKKGGKVTNEENSTFTVGKEEDTSNGELTNSGEIENKGFWTSYGKVTNNDDGELENSGNFTAKGKVENKGSMSNTGLFSVEGEGDDNGFENSGTLYNGDTGTLSVEGDFKNSGKGNGEDSQQPPDKKGVTNDGIITVKGKTTNSGDLTNNNQFTATGETENSGTITNSGTYDAMGKFDNKKGENGSSGTLTNKNDGEFTAHGEFNNDGKVTNESGGIMTFEDKVTGGENSESGGESNAEIENSGELNLEGDASGYKGKFKQSDENSVTNVGSEENRDAKFFGGESDISDGTINWWADEEEESGKLKMTGGSLNLKSGSRFTFGSGGNIEDDVKLNIEEGSTLDIEDQAELKLDSEDEWNGTIEIGNDGEEDGKSGGSLEADGVKNGGSAVLKQSGGKSTFKNGSDITISGDSDISGGEVTLDGSTLSFDQHRGEKAKAKFTVKGNSTIGLLNGGIDCANFEDLTVDDTGNFTVDLEQRTYTGDKFNFGKFNDGEQEQEGNPRLNISDFNMLGDCPVDRVTRYQLFAFSTDDNGTFPENTEFSATKELKRTPSGWYGLKPVNGMKGYYDLYMADYVPEEFRGQAAILGMYTNQLQVDDTILNHFIIHDETLTDKAENANKYSAVSPLFAPYQKTFKDGGIWSKSYANFGRMDITEPDLDVGNNVYGTIAGVDFPAIELNSEWEFIPTGYIGYSGAHQYFNGVSSYQNAGQLGVMGTFIRNQDFITSVLAYGGGYTNEMSYSAYEDNLTNWLAGSALKTAYNFHPFKDFIIQPTAFVSYNAFGKQNWHSNYGNIDMSTGMFNGINAGPGVNFILSKETWSLYSAFQYLLFMNDSVKGTIGNINLPETKMDHGIFSYGFGATKTLKDTFTAYAQMNFYNAGYTGIGFQLGFRWLFDTKLPWMLKNKTVKKSPEKQLKEVSNKSNEEISEINFDLIKLNDEKSLNKQNADDILPSNGVSPENVETPAEPQAKPIKKRLFHKKSSKKQLKEVSNKLNDEKSLNKQNADDILPSNGVSPENVETPAEPQAKPFKKRLFHKKSGKKAPKILDNTADFPSVTPVTRKRVLKRNGNGWTTVETSDASVSDSYNYIIRVLSKC